MNKLPEADIRNVTWGSNVYEPSDDSFALVDAVNAWLQQVASTAYQQLPIVCVEIGCGSGYVICSIALALQQLYKQSRSCAPDNASSNCSSTGRNCSYLATDINPEAVAATAQTLQAHGVAGVELVQTDLLTGLMPRLTGSVDLLLFNPPYVPTPDDEVLREGIARAWAGGHRGRVVTDRVLPLLSQLLSPGGHAFIVTVPENQPQDIINLLQAQGLAASITLSRTADEECLQIVHAHW